MANPQNRSHYQLTFAVLAVSVASFALLQSLVTPVLSEIQVDLNTDQTTVTWVLTAYLLSASVFTPIIGRIGDKVGKEKLLVVALVGLAIGSIIAALATSIGPMIVARIIQGVGGGVLPLAFGIIRDEFPEKKIPGAVGIIASLAAVGAGVGLVLAGPIVEALNYHWLFWIPGIVTAVAAVAAFFVVPASPVRTPGKISVLPAVLLSAWLVCLLLALSQGRSWGWTSGRVLGLIVAAVVLAVAWVMVEERSESPLIDMTMMRLPAVWTTNLVALLVGFAMYASFGFLPQFTQTPTEAGYGFGASITESGLILLPSSVTMFVVGLLSGTFVRLIGPKTVVVIGSLIAASSMAILAFAHDEKWELYVANAIMGVGVGLIFACLSNLIVAAVPPEQTGVASGMNANIRTIGGSVGAAVMASIVTASVFPNGLPKESGYTNGFIMLTIAFVVAALVALLIPRVKREVIEEHLVGEPEHPELGMVAAGTLVGDKSE
ncbi:MULTISPECIES: MFS transporter [Aeromicrobium]|uniref:MFS transporter n=1 Tax=Aeromicrobium TaxID=2040 RepID=UPI001ABB585A|nr:MULTISPECIES: MFS transporter [Aeromicrobium]